MKNFSETGAASVELGLRNFASPTDLTGYVLIAYSARLEDTQWGEKWLVDCAISGSEDHKLVTFTPDMPAGRQIAALHPSDFPFEFRIKRLGRTFQLTGPDSTD